MKAVHHGKVNDLSTGSIDLYDGEEFVARLTIIRANPRGDDIKNYFGYCHRIIEQVLTQINDGRPHAKWPDYTGELPPVGQVYRHYKGDLYEVTGYATCTETQWAKILYRKPNSIFKNEWDRPLDMWFEAIDDHGTTRFTHIPNYGEVQNDEVPLLTAEGE